MWIKEIAIGCPHVPPGRSAASAFQHELPRHELAIIFADRACRRTKAGMGPIGAAGPFPYIAEHLAKCSRLFAGDRKSDVKGKSVSERVDLGGRRLFKKKQYNNTIQTPKQK